VTRPPSDDATRRDSSRAWYCQGIVWLGIGVLAASAAGSVWLIAVAQQYADPPLPHDGPRVFKEVPVARPPAAQPPQAPPPAQAPLDGGR